VPVHFYWLITPAHTLQNVAERYHTVEADIGAVELKNFVFERLKRKLAEDTNQFQFSITDFDMYGPGQAPLEHGVVGPPLHAQCYKSVTRTGITKRVFQPNAKVEVMLILKKDTHRRVEEWNMRAELLVR
jgi:hypothetical protein